MLRPKSRIRFAQILVPTLAILVSNAPALAAGNGQGKVLYEKNCVGCHDDSVYKRSDRRVENLSALKKQITGCEHAANAKLSPAQIDDLTHYLNSQYYRFK